MLATEHIDTARQFLLDADREYEAGDILQASEKLWGAATHVVIAEMQRRDLEPNGHGKMKRFVRSLGDELDHPTCMRFSKSQRLCTSTSITGF